MGPAGFGLVLTCFQPPLWPSSGLSITSELSEVPLEANNMV